MDLGEQEQTGGFYRSLRITVPSVWLSKVKEINKYNLQTRNAPFISPLVRARVFISVFVCLCRCFHFNAFIPFCETEELHFLYRYGFIEYLMDEV